MRVTHLMLAATAALALAGPALGHSPYLAPVTFAPDREYVTVQGAMSESNFFVPDFPIRAAGDYWATGPSGEAVSIGPGVNLKEMSVIEVALPQEGTWKISTGDRGGRVGRFANIGGQWKSIRAPQGGRDGANVIDEAAVPAGAEIVESAGTLKAETYVTRGAPSQGALKATGKGFEITPVTHPNELFAGDAFDILVTIDGKPVSGVDFPIARAGDIYAEKKFTYAGKTDAVGAAAITFADPGAYVLESHYGQVEPGSKPNPKTYTYSLSFEVTK